MYRNILLRARKHRLQKKVDKFIQQRSNTENLKIEDKSDMNIPILKFNKYSEYKKSKRKTI